MSSRLLRHQTKPWPRFDKEQEVIELVGLTGKVATRISSRRKAPTPCRNISCPNLGGVHDVWATDGDGPRECPETCRKRTL